MIATTPRVLLVGMGAPGGIGRVEQLIAEAARIEDSGPKVELTALWRHQHPEYLRAGALEDLPSVSDDPTKNLRQFVVRLAKAIRDVRPDFVLYTHVNLARPAPWLRAIGHPAHYGVWVYGIDVWDRLSALHRVALRRATVVLTISRWSADRTVAAQGVPRRLIRVIPLTVPAEVFDMPERSEFLRERGRILTVARLARTEERKGLDQLIRAMSEVSRCVSGAHLVIVGDGDDRIRLERLAAEYGLADSVHFAGHVSDARLDEEYRRAELFVLPSAKEGFGLVFIEAMLHGIPVVGLAVGGPLDIVRHNIDGLLLDDLDRLPTAICTLLSDRARLERMGAAARQSIIQRFSPTRFRTELFRSLEVQPDASRAANAAK